MATYYLIETRNGEDDEWTDELPVVPPVLPVLRVGGNYFKTDDDAWLAIGQLRDLGGAWARSEYRVAIYAGPEDDERLWGYAL